MFLDLLRRRNPAFVLAAQQVRAEEGTGTVAPGEEVRLSERQRDWLAIFAFEEVQRCQSARASHAFDLRFAQGDRVLAAAVRRAFGGEADERRLPGEQKFVTPEMAGYGIPGSELGVPYICREFA